MIAPFMACACTTINLFFSCGKHLLLFRCVAVDVVRVKKLLWCVDVDVARVMTHVWCVDVDVVRVDVDFVRDNLITTQHGLLFDIL